MFEIRKATTKDYPEIQNLIHFTVRTCYPAIYPPEVVDFFIQYHSLDEIERRAGSGIVLVLVIEDNIKSTGFLCDEEMGGVYVYPVYQRKGLGTAIVTKLLDSAYKQKLEKVWLDATPLARPLYEKFKFDLTSPMVHMVGEVPLHYFRMEKKLSLSN